MFKWLVKGSNSRLDVPKTPLLPKAEDGKDEVEKLVRASVNKEVDKAVLEGPSLLAKKRGRYFRYDGET